MPLKNNGKLPNHAGILYGNTGSCENLASLKSLGNITQGKKKKISVRQSGINMQQWRSPLSYNYAVD